MKTKLLIGALALSTMMLTGCGGGSSSSTGTTTPPPIATPDPTEPQLSVNGNPILVPGYTYNCHTDRMFEMYVAQKGRAVITGQGDFFVYDTNFNQINENTNLKIQGMTLNTGHYYVSVWNCYKKGDGRFTINSNVLYNPLAQ